MNHLHLLNVVNVENLINLLEFMIMMIVKDENIYVNFVILYFVEI